MDVDTATTSIPFQKLMGKERAKFRAEGRCFSMPKPKLSYAQQICALKEKMIEEE